MEKITWKEIEKIIEKEKLEDDNVYYDTANGTDCPMSFGDICCEVITFLQEGPRGNFDITEEIYFDKDDWGYSIENILDSLSLSLKRVIGK